MSVYGKVLTEGLKNVGLQLRRSRLLKCRLLSAKSLVLYVNDFFDLLNEQKHNFLLSKITLLISMLSKVWAKRRSEIALSMDSGAVSSNLKCLSRPMVEPEVPFYRLRFRIFEPKVNEQIANSDILPIQWEAY